MPAKGPAREACVNPNIGAHFFLRRVSRPFGQARTTDVFKQMDSIRDCIAVLPEEPQRVSASKLVLITAESVDDWTNRKDQADSRLRGGGYLFLFALLNEKGSPAKEHGRLGQKSEGALHVPNCQLGHLLEARGPQKTVRV